MNWTTCCAVCRDLVRLEQALSLPKEEPGSPGLSFCSILLPLFNIWLLLTLFSNSPIYERCGQQFNSEEGKSRQSGRDWEREHGGRNEELGMKTGEEHHAHRPLAVIFKRLCLGIDPCGQRSPGVARKSLQTQTSEMLLHCRRGIGKRRGIANVITRRRDSFRSSLAKFFVTFPTIRQRVPVFIYVSGKNKAIWSLSIDLPFSLHC